MTAFKIGAYFPHTEIRADVVEIRDFVQAVEDMGFSYLANADHVIGANRASRPDWAGPYDSTSRMYEPLVLFSYLAGVTKTIEFVTSVIIAPQRQTVLIAKQAANLDLFCGGRLRLGLGTGWNTVEYEALSTPWDDRGARLDDQILVLRRLWSEEAITERSRFHTISDAGLAPMPVQRPIPIWIGGVAKAAMLRAARLGDGWMPFLSADGAKETIARYHKAVRDAGRDPANAPLENVVHLGTSGGGPKREVNDVIADAAIWKEAGASGVCIYTMNRGLNSTAEHLAVFRKIADVLRLSKKPH